jgi:hypothetical protein
MWRAASPGREEWAVASWSRRTRGGVLFGYLVFSLTVVIIASVILAPTLAAVAQKGTT